MSGVITPVLLVVIVGLVASTLLVIASKVFFVPVDERVTAVREVLPGANCGGCGFAGCDDYASALVEDESTSCTKCSVGGAAVSEQIAEILGRNAGAMDKNFALVMCTGDNSAAKKIMEWQGMQSCKGAKTFFDGMSACSYGCLGLGDCSASCEFNAIGVVDGVAVVNRDNCVACGACIKACPQHIIKLVPEKAKVHVLCRSQDKGGVTRKNCEHGCIACHKCEKVCPFGAITIENNLSEIHVDKCKSCGLCVQECPTTSINSFKPIKRKPPKAKAAPAKPAAGGTPAKAEPAKAEPAAKEPEKAEPAKEEATA